MRFTKERIKHLSSVLVSRLQEEGFLEVSGSEDVLLQSLETAIWQELTVEDRLNAEVREILQQYQSEFDEGRADYQKTFSMIKNKLVRERCLIL